MAEKYEKIDNCVTFLCMIALRNKKVAHTFLPSFDNANVCLGHTLRIETVETQKLCYQGNVSFEVSQ